MTPAPTCSGVSRDLFSQQACPSSLGISLQPHNHNYQNSEPCGTCVGLPISTPLLMSWKTRGLRACGPGQASSRGWRSTWQLALNGLGQGSRGEAQRSCHFQSSRWSRPHRDSPPFGRSASSRSQGQARDLLSIALGHTFQRRNRGKQSWAPVSSPFGDPKEIVIFPLKTLVPGSPGKGERIVFLGQVLGPEAPLGLTSCPFLSSLTFSLLSKPTSTLLPQGLCTGQSLCLELACGVTIAHTITY